MKSVVQDEGKLYVQIWCNSFNKDDAKDTLNLGGKLAKIDRKHGTVHFDPDNGQKKCRKA